MMKSRKTKWVEHGGDEKLAKKNLVKMILKWILRKQSGRVWTGFIWLRTGTVGKFL
jgi:hypothetical protein